jgi:hypothetical protein
VVGRICSHVLTVWTVGWGGYVLCTDCLGANQLERLKSFRPCLPRTQVSLRTAAIRVSLRGLILWPHLLTRLHTGGWSALGKAAEGGWVPFAFPPRVG